jgi:hypothetical protein
MNLTTETRVPLGGTHMTTYSCSLYADAVATVAICFPSQSVYRYNAVYKNSLRET